MLQINLCEARNSASCLPPSPSSFTIVPAVRAGRSVADSTTVIGALQAQFATFQVKVVQAQGVHRLLLRRHSLERGVTGLAGPVGDGHNRRQPRFQQLGGSVAVAAPLDRAVLDAHLGQQRDLGDAQALGEHGRDNTHGAVGGGHPADDEVVAGLLNRLGQQQGCTDRIGAVQLVVFYVDRRRTRPTPPTCRTTFPRRSSPARSSAWPPTGSSADARGRRPR